MSESISRTLKYYADVDGKEPFADWFVHLRRKDPLTAVKIGKYLERLKQGNWGNAKRLTDGAGVWELVIDLGPGYRVYLGLVGDVIILLLLGGVKKRQTRDIQIAIELWNEFKKRNKGEGA